MWKLLFLMLLAPLFLIAHHDGTTEHNKTILLKTGDYIEHNRIIIAKSILLVTNSIDDFFIEEEFDEELRNKSYGRIEFATIKQEGKKLSYETNIKLSLDLPETKKRIKLIFDNDEDEHARDTPLQTIQENDFTSSVGYSFQNDRYFSIQTSLGAKFSSNINPFLRLRVRSNYYLKTYKFTLAEKLTFFAESENIYTTYFDIAKTINDTFSIKLLNQGEFYSDSEIFDLTSSINLYHILNKKEGLAYSVSTNGDNKDNLYNRDFTYSLTYKNRFKSGYYYDIIPAILDKEEFNHKLKSSLTLKVGIEFFSE